MRILLIPGIGDIHWVALKLQSFLARRGETVADVTVWNFDDRPRSMDFVDRIPFMRAAGYLNQPIASDKGVFHWLYMTGALERIEGFRGFDHLICVNGSLRVGRSMDDILPECAIDWDYPIEEREDEAAWADRQREAGPYILLSFSDHGMFAWWVRCLPAPVLRRMLQGIHDAFPDHRLILTGSAWDATFSRHLATEPYIVDMVGKTSLGRLLSLTRRATAFVGWCGGNTIVSTHLRTPTVMLWSEYFPDKRFHTNWVRPGESRYVPMMVEDLTTDSLVRATQRAVESNMAAAHG